MFPSLLTDAQLQVSLRIILNIDETIISEISLKRYDEFRQLSVFIFCV